MLKRNALVLIVVGCLASPFSTPEARAGKWYTVGNVVCATLIALSASVFYDFGVDAISERGDFTPAVPRIWTSHLPPARFFGIRPGKAYGFQFEIVDPSSVDLDLTVHLYPDRQGTALDGSLTFELTVNGIPYPLELEDEGDLNWWVGETERRFCAYLRNQPLGLVVGEKCELRVTHEQDGPVPSPIEFALRRVRGLRSIRFEPSHLLVKLYE